MTGYLQITHDMSGVFTQDKGYLHNVRGIYTGLEIWWNLHRVRGIYTG